MTQSIWISCDDPNYREVKAYLFRSTDSDGAEDV